MIYCPKCKSAVDPDSRFCDQCGQEIFYCTRCGRPGKGMRCTMCGSPTARYDELQEQGGHVHTTNPTMATTRGGRGMTTQGTLQPEVPQLVLANDSLQLRLVGVNGAVLGRRIGIYHDLLAQCHYISSKHAQLAYGEQGWTVMDCGSSNGTYLNGNQLEVNVPTALLPGDRLVLANVEFRVEFK